MKEIRHISTPFQSSIIAVAEFEKIVQIIDISNKKIIAEFETILDFGGRRLVISENARICVCGCWERFGICGYDVKTGQMIWQRKDLKKVQNIQVVRSHRNQLFARFETGASRLLDINTGADITKINGVKNYYESKFQPLTALDKSTKIELIDRNHLKPLVKIDRQSFATLDIAFGPDSVLISEAGGPVSCYCGKNGLLKWRIKKNEDEHYVRVCFNEEIDRFIALSQPFEDSDKRLLYINPQTGEIQYEMNILRPVVAEFMADGKSLVTSDRNVILLKSGETKKW